MDHRRSRPDRAGAAEPRRQCATPCQGGELRISATIELRAYEVGHDVISAPEVVLRLADTGQHVARRAGAAVRAVFHDQGARQGHRPRAVDLLYAIVAESGRPHHRREPSRRRHDVLRRAAAGAAARVRHHRRPASVLHVRPRPRPVPARCWSSRTKRRSAISSPAPCIGPATPCCRPRMRPRRWPCLRGQGGADRSAADGRDHAGRNGRELARTRSSSSPACRCVHVGYADRTFGPKDQRARRRVLQQAVRARRAGGTVRQVIGATPGGTARAKTSGRCRRRTVR